MDINMLGQMWLGFLIQKIFNIECGKRELKNTHTMKNLILPKLLHPKVKSFGHSDTHFQCEASPLPL